jgi:hypothetical protein
VLQSLKEIDPIVRRRVPGGKSAGIRTASRSNAAMAPDLAMNRMPIYAAGPGERFVGADRPT